jgi:hypothetical protein
MAAKLKVFRTAVGFRDAYVAAPSKAAALRAWGTDKDLFARGSAELVTDEALQQEALNKPGEVVYRTRGGLEEQIAALGKLPDRKSKSKSEDVPKAATKADPKARAKPKPRPSRAKLEAAEQALIGLENEREEAEAAMRERERALAAERNAMEASFAKRAERLKEAEKKAREAYQAALRTWEP